MTIGDRLKQCRVALGYSAETVAEKLHISPATMYRYENGDIAKMPARLLEPLARILSTTPGYLMGWSTEGAPVVSPALSPDDSHLLQVYHAADPKYQSLALELLEEHPAQNHGKNHPVSDLADQA